MYYEINVAKDGRHYFATHERSLQSKEEALEVYRMFKVVFPKSKGFEISVCERRVVGAYVTISFEKELELKDQTEAEKKKLHRRIKRK